MSFGFGVGDFLAAATLAWKLSTALRSAKGASASYHNLIEELESTAQSLYHAGNQLETAGLPASPASCVSHGLSRCHTNLRLLDVIVKKYAESMQTPKGKERDWHSGWGVKTGLKKIKWEMCEKEGVDEIRRNIRSGVADIMLILEACGLNAIGRMESRIRETCALVKRVEAAIPQGLGTWYWDHKVIYLDDALGRSIPIPFELCSQWEVFNETLKLVFRGRPGSSRIEAKLFTVTTQDNVPVLPAKWESSVKPSTTLLMSMVVRKQLGDAHSCPVCNEPQPDSLPADKSASQICKARHIQCAKCLVWYSVAPPELVSESLSREVTDKNADNANEPQMKLNSISAQEEDVDIKSFKRLNLIQWPPTSHAPPSVAQDNNRALGAHPESVPSTHTASSSLIELARTQERDDLALAKKVLLERSKLRAAEREARMREEREMHRALLESNERIAKMQAEAQMRQFEMLARLLGQRMVEEGEKQHSQGTSVQSQ